MPRDDLVAIQVSTNDQEDYWAWLWNPGEGKAESQRVMHRRCGAGANGYFTAAVDWDEKG